MLPFIYIYKFSADRFGKFGNLEDGALMDMKLRKVILGIAVLGVLAAPVRSSAGGMLSGIGLMAGEEDGGLEIYQVTLPTDDALGIILDPEGLSSFDEEGEYDPSWAGKIQMKKNGGALFINQSSFPIKVKVELSVAQDRDGTPSTIALLKKDAGIDDSVWPQMYLAAIPGAEKTRTMDDFVPSDTEIPVVANGGDQKWTNFSFLLEGSVYTQDEETGEYVLEDFEDNYDSASFILGGRVNKNADWSDYVGTGKEQLFVRAVYTIQKQKIYDEERLYQAEDGAEDELLPHALIKKSRAKRKKGDEK